MKGMSAICFQNGLIALFKIYIYIYVCIMPNISRGVCIQIIIKYSIYLGTNLFFLDGFGHRATERAKQELYHPVFCSDKGTK